MVKVYAASLDLRDDIHSLLQNATRAGKQRLREKLSQWTDSAPTDPRLPKFLLVPLEAHNSSCLDTRLSKEILSPSSVAKLHTLGGQIEGRDCICYLALVECTPSNTQSASRFKELPDLVELLQIANLDGSPVEDDCKSANESSVHVHYSQSVLVPSNVYFRPGSSKLHSMEAPRTRTCTQRLCNQR
jgi:hypothetical protein